MSQTVHAHDTTCRYLLISFPLIHNCILQLSNDEFSRLVDAKIAEQEALIVPSAWSLKANLRHLDLRHLADSV